MKTQKLKKYVIMVSFAYPAYHSKKGLPTYFVEKIVNSINPGIAFIDHYGCKIEKGKYELTEPMACIHFTNFRYGPTNSN